MFGIDWDDGVHTRALSARSFRFNLRVAAGDREWEQFSPNFLAYITRPQWECAPVHISTPL